MVRFPFSAFTLLVAANLAAQPGFAQARALRYHRPADRAPFIKDGRIVCLAVGTPARSPLLPDVPTIAQVITRAGLRAK